MDIIRNRIKDEYIDIEPHNWGCDCFCWFDGGCDCGCAVS